MLLIVLTNNWRIFHSIIIVIRRNHKNDFEICRLCWKCKLCNCCWIFLIKYVSCNHQLNTWFCFIISNCLSICGSCKWYGCFVLNRFKWCCLIYVWCHQRCLCWIKYHIIIYRCNFQKSLGICNLSRWNVKIHESIECVIVRRIVKHCWSF